MKYKRLVLAIFSLSLICLSGFLITKGVTSINSAYPAPPVFIESEGESIPVSRTKGVTFTVNDTLALNKEEIQSVLPKSYQSRVGNFDDFVSIVISISVTNNSNSMQNIDSLRESMLSIGKTYSNGIDLPSTLELSENNADTTIEPHESKDISFVYTVFSNSFPHEIWNSLTENDIYFVHNLYPTINKIRLNVKSPASETSFYNLIDSK